MVLDSKTGFFLKYNVLASFRKSFEKWHFWGFPLCSTLNRSLEKVQKKRLVSCEVGWFQYAMFIKVDWYFLFLIHYSLKFQYPVTNFTLTCTCSLKKSHHGGIKIISRKFTRNWLKQNQFLIFLHFSFLSNYAVVMPLYH